jgi:hypothetical protein
MSPKTTPDWIVIQDGTGGDDAYSLSCEHCGARQRFEVPLSVTYWCDVAKAFEREHRRCQEAELVQPAKKRKGWGP